LRILENEGYILGYNKGRGNPVWVSYRAFTPDSMDAPERPERFTPDTRTGLNFLAALDQITQDALETHANRRVW
jgi:DNA/RNA endonuclease G (NUC1)